MRDLHPKSESDTHGLTDASLCDLILQAQEGSQEAYRMLCTKYRPLLESSVARFGAVEMTLQEKADMREEAERVFLGAITSFDTEQDAVDFGLYAKICLRNGLISEWRRIHARRRVTPVSLTEEDMTVGYDPGTDMVEEERFRQLCHTVRGHLSELENRVWWQYVTGIPVADIAKDLNRDERSVHNAIYRIRRKLRERLTPPED